MKRVYYILIRAFDSTWVGFMAGIGATVMFTYFLSNDYVPDFWTIIILCTCSLIGAAIISRLRGLRDKEFNKMQYAPVRQGEKRLDTKEMENAAAGWAERGRPFKFASGFLLMTGGLIAALIIVAMHRTQEQSTKQKLVVAEKQIDKMKIESDSLKEKNMKLVADTLRLHYLYEQVKISWPMGKPTSKKIEKKLE